MNVNATFDKEYERSEQTRIEHITHRIWVSHPADPVEVFDFFGPNTTILNQTVYDRLLETNYLFAANGTEEWTHYLWVNEKSSLPATVAWFEENGFIVKEFRELSDDPLAVAKFYEYVDARRYGAADDLGKAYVLWCLGGVYLDLDVYLEHWDGELLHVFDSLFVKEDFGAYGVTLFNSDLVFARARHPILAYTLELFKEQFTPAGKDRIQVRPCFQGLHYITPYDAGVYHMINAYVVKAWQNGSNDGLLRPKNRQVDKYIIKYTDGTTKEIYFYAKSLVIGSWTNDLEDSLRFGFG